VSVEVKDAKAERKVSFNNEVMPVLTRAGCNQGACHGSQYGKGGFKLSLLCYDPEVDYAALVRQFAARRVSLGNPSQSLILRKPTMKLPHGGGLRFKPGSFEYRTLLAWIEDGAPGPEPKEPSVTAVSVLPPARVMAPGQRQKLVALANYSDGSVCDVTATARFNTLNDAVAKLSDTAPNEVTTAGRGETAVMVRFMGRVAVARITVPYGHLDRPVDFPPNNSIDGLVAAKWERMGLRPSGLCTDEEFLRRASLDAIGTLPSPEEARAFLESKDSDKRSKWIDQLLARSEYADYWSLKWGDLLRDDRQKLGEKGMWSYTNWIRAAMRENRPLDQFVRDLITAQGSTYANGPANFYRVARSPTELAETTSQVFLGIRIQCAKCHHHPYEKWGQPDYYSLAAFFARVGLKGSDDYGIFGQEEIVRLTPSGEVTLPKSGKVAEPHPPDGPPMNDPVDRRRALAVWLTSKDNLQFARNLVNRFWGYLMGRGIVEPIDDMRSTNPPSNPELLDALAKEFIAHGFDQKQLLRTIMNSRVYQLSANATPANRQDEVFFTKYMVRRMPAEVLLDAIDFATGTTEKFNRLPKGTRAISLPDPQVSSYFLDTFGRPQRLVSCECERTGEPNISQALDLMNGDAVQEKVASPQGRLAKLLEAKKSDDEILNDLYLATLSRLPRPAEIASVQKAFRQPPMPKEALYRLPAVVLNLAGAPRGGGQSLANASLQLERALNRPPTREERFEDILWALINSREFIFNH